MWPSELLRRDSGATRVLILSIVCGAGASIAFALWTVQLAQIIAAVFIDGRSLSDLAGPFAILSALTVLQTVGLRLRRPLAQQASNRIRGALRDDLLRVALQDSTRPGHLNSAQQHSLIGDGVDSLDDYITQFLPSLAIAGVIPPVVLILIALLDPWTTLVLAFAGPMLIALLVVIGRRTRDLADARFRELSWLGSLYADLLGGLATLKIFGREAEALDTVSETSTSFGGSTMKVLRTAFQTSLVIEWAATASTALVAVEVSFRLVDRQLSFATALAVLMLTPEFFSPLRRLAADYHAGQTGAAALAPILSTIDGSSDMTFTDSSTNRLDTATTTRSLPSSHPPAISFEDVHLTHRDRSAESLPSLSFSIESGETVALLGPSGSGKTTATMALLGFEVPDTGVIRIDGAPLSTLDISAWRAQIAWVPQNPTIFSGSIADNIRLGVPGASAEQVESASRVAAIHDFIMTIPGGYSAQVGSRGMRLSGGQRQRIALARAVLLERPVMVLDEFTAHLDPDTEMQVLDALTPVLRNRTVLLITHRTSALRLADRVVTIDAVRRERSEP